jgi:16S rRNA (cytosine1402-N4)-methyltransferase
MRLLRRFAFVHYPVMWREIIKILEGNILSSPKLFADCTVGAGGHSKCLLETFPDSYVIGTDLDKEIIQISENFLKDYKERVEIHHTSYTNIFKTPRFPSIFSPNKKFDGIILDLGLSSYQMDSPDRGFSFKTAGKLDMRFDNSDDHNITAEKFINFASELEISQVFEKYGEEQDSKKAAEIICQYRKEQKITTTDQLSKVLNYAFFISKSINKYTSITKCFQAIRIFVNRELENLEKVLTTAINHIENQGILIVISFHSLEDNIVYKKLKEYVSHK